MLKFIRKFLSNEERFTPDNPDFRKVFIINALLLTLFVNCMSFTILNIIINSNVKNIYFNLFASILAMILLINFRISQNIKATTILSVLLFTSALIIYLNFAQGRNYSIFWITVFPCFSYFLLGRKAASVLTAFFMTYILYFMITGIDKWKPDEFNIKSVLNISFSSLLIIIIISIYEASRSEDVIALHNAYKVLKESKEELHLILDSAAEGILGVDENGVCTFCNAQCLEILGYKDEQELLGNEIHYPIHSSNQDGSPLTEADCLICRSLKTGEKVHSADEVFRRTDSSLINVEYYVYPRYKDNVINGAVITFMDITDRKKNVERINYISCHDSLSGLLNRQCFEEQLSYYDNSEFWPISLVFGDLNGLKLTNDIFGHPAGDSFIKKTAEIIRKVCRESDLAARVGGDEYIIMLPRTGYDGARRVIDRINAEMSKEKFHSMKLSMSMGCDTKTDLNQDIEQVLKNAENNMYREKSIMKKTQGMETINEIMINLYERSPREKAHSEIISDLCRRIGTALCWPESEIKILKDAGYFHDIGKIVLDDDLLNNTNVVSEEDKLKKQQHSVAGYRILNLFDNTLDLAEAVYYHHEKWNGTGYPKGLKGREIPIQSRIIAIAEQYDYLTNKEDYFKMSKSEALTRISNLSGINYDPKLVDVFIRVCSESKDL